MTQRLYSPGVIFHWRNTPRYFNRFLTAVRRPALILAANSAALLVNASETGQPFVLQQEDGFFIPYGDYPHKAGLQKFDKAAADEMVAAHNSALGKIKRAVGFSYPVFVGHPDVPGTKDTDKKAYGWIETMEAANDGMKLGVKWSPAGRELVENGHFRFYSPTWWTRKTSGGIRPVAFKSMGLTNDPNIPVPALANEAESETQDGGTPAPEEEAAPAQIAAEIRAALKLDDKADLAAVLAAIQKLTTPPEDPEKAKLADDLAAEKKAKEAVENELATARAKHTAANERIKAAIGEAVQGAVSAGRVLPVNAESKTAELLAANDLAEALQALGKLPAVMKTQSATGDLGAAKVRVVTAANDASATRREERRVAVANEYERTNPAMSVGERKRIAHERAARKNPDLFKNQSPEAAA